MPICPLCNKSAGWFRKYHQDCAIKYVTNIEQLLDNIRHSVQNGQDFQSDFDLVNSLILPGDSFDFASMEEKWLNDHTDYDSIEDNPRWMMHYREEGILRSYSITFDLTLMQMLDDGILTIEEEKTLKAFRNAVTRKFKESSSLNSFSTLDELFAMGIAIRKISNGEPVKCDSSGFVLNQDESPYILFKYVEIKKSKTHRKTRYVGSSAGISIRLAKGVWYRTSSFKGHPIVDEYKTTEVADSGPLLITNKAIRYAGRKQSAMIRFDKINNIDFFYDTFIISKQGKQEPYTFHLNTLYVPIIANLLSILGLHELASVEAVENDLYDDSED